MGVNISSKNRDTTMGYLGFQRLRRTIAGLCPKEIAEHYNRMLDNYREILADEKVDEYNKEVDRLYAVFGRQYGKVLDFLYASDCDAEMTYGTAKQLLSVIGDYDDNIIYGYPGHGDKAARFRDFKELLQDAADTKTNWCWY